MVLLFADATDCAEFVSLVEEDLLVSDVAVVSLAVLESLTDATTTLGES